MNRLTAAVAGIITAGVIVTGVAENAGAATATQQQRAPHLFQPCPTEDSAHCVWRGNVRGDGEGRSFYSGPNADPAPKVTLIRHSVARALLHARGHWQPVAGTRWEGKRFDNVSGRGTFVLGPRAKVSIGDTTYAKTAGMRHVGSS